MAAIQPMTLKDLSASVTKFIKEEKANIGDGSSVAMATHLLIAIENAANIFKDCPPDQLPSLNAKIGDFQQMLAALKKTDYCSLNLPACIQHSIDTCTSDSSKPLVYFTYPQHIVPGLEVTVEVFGKFKYANKTKYGDTYQPTLHFGEQTFTPIKRDSHTLTFKLSFPDLLSYFKADKFSRLDVKLVVPYEAGYLGMVYANKRRFIFNFPIRALPINAGVLDLTSKQVVDPHSERISAQLLALKQMVGGGDTLSSARYALGRDEPSSVRYTMGWGETRFITLNPSIADKFTFTSFDGLKQEFTAADLEAEFIASKNTWLTKRVSYLTISKYPAAKGKNPHEWKITTVAPAGL